MSFDIALSGIQSINEQLETISNNIANAGTYGFKAGRANFASMYSGDQATGVEVGSHTQNIGLAGGLVTTGRSLDAAINGRGFFVSKTAQGTLAYSRVGIFDVDKNGYLADASGARVQGYAPVTGSSALGPMGDLKVPSGQIPAVASTKLDFVANMSADWTPPATAPFNAADPTSYNMSKLSVLYDSLGAKHSLTQYFVKGAAGDVTAYYTFDGAAVATSTTLTFNTSGQLTAPAAPVTLAFAPAGAAAMSVRVNYAGTSAYAGEAVTSTNAADGSASGTLVGVELAGDGTLVAKYSNDARQPVGTLALATFPDEGKLTPAGNTTWVESSESGAALYNQPGAGLAGTLATSTLEGSNVDITAELVGLMSSQRNYQANSKVISTENQMMQSLMQAL
jgi:flagellar hook protein FlgE